MMLKSQKSNFIGLNWFNPYHWLAWDCAMMASWGDVWLGPEKWVVIHVTVVAAKKHCSIFAKGWFIYDVHVWAGDEEKSAWKNRSHPAITPLYGCGGFSILYQKVIADMYVHLVFLDDEGGGVGPCPVTQELWNSFACFLWVLRFHTQGSNCLHTIYQLIAAESTCSQSQLNVLGCSVALRHLPRDLDFASVIHILT